MKNNPMKYIKSRKIFEDNQIELDEKDSHTIVNTKNKLNDYIKDTSEYNTKKKSLESLILNNVENKDIDQSITKLIGDNKMLAMYLPIIHIKKQLSDIEKKIKYDRDSINSRKSDIINANQLVDVKDKTEQVTKINSQIKDINDRISENTSKLNALKTQLLKEETELNKKIIDGKKEIENSIKSLSKP